MEYLIFKHDELRKTPILDQNGNRIMRDEFYLDGLNCEPYSFDAACQQLNREYQKNKNKNEIKSHHYIISFDPQDSTENCLTGKRAQELGLEYAKANFPGHQALVCTHMDGHNGSGNIHVHIVINSLRKLDVQSCHAQADGGAQKDSSSSVMRPVPIHTASCLISLLQYIIRTVSLFCIFVTVHTRVPSNGILPMLRIPNRQNLLPELYRTDFSVQKIPTCEQLRIFHAG